MAQSNDDITQYIIAVNECKNRGWWLPAGHVDRGQNFVQAAYRETLEEAGIDIELKGVLAVEHSLVSDQAARMRVIFYAIPTDPSQSPKSVPDAESNGAAWLTLEELKQKLDHPPPVGLRGEELLRWGTYVASGGLISPISVNERGQYDGFFRLEDSGPASYHATPVVAVGSETDPFRASLLKGSINLSAEGEKKWTILHHAVAEDNIEKVRLLLIAGADPNGVTHKGRSTLHFAAGRNNLDMIRLLLTAGANPCLCDAGGATPAEYAVSDKCKSALVNKPLSS